LQGTIETKVGAFVLIALLIFIYMGFKVGAFRFDRSNYYQYEINFDDISGLTRKADVKIAGVKVGWIEEVQLTINDHYMKAKATIMIQKDYKLYQDARAKVQQDGLLGQKFLEIIPGSPSLDVLVTGEHFQEPSIKPVSIDDLLHQFKDIASDVQEVSESFKQALGGPDGTEQLKILIDNLTSASDNIASFSSTIDRAVQDNEIHLDSFLQLGTTIKGLTVKLEEETLPSFQDSIEKISDVFDRDFNRIATNFEYVTGSIDQAAIEAKNGLISITSVADKINDGTGLIGKLINEDEIYNDIESAVHGFKNYVTKLDRMQIIFDTHAEKMHRPAENYEFEDSKGYLNLRIHFTEDYFLVVQYVQSEKGFIHRKETLSEYTDEFNDSCLINRESTGITNQDIKNFGQEGFLQQADPAFVKIIATDTILDNELDVRRRRVKLERDSGALSLQFGKTFNRVALRAGLFDGFAGAGIDIDIPLPYKDMRWVTTAELYDFNGRNRLNDRRPHFKWINRIYAMRNLYFTFGADDFASKRNASAFYGVGLRFGDDDLKYLLGGLSGIPGGL
jgi:phospholipid/cholesterol/gamma-HCH transport system substrate-binding protein